MKKKLINIAIGIIGISLIIIAINKIFFYNEVMISLQGYKKAWQMKHLAMNIIMSVIMSLIYSYIVFSKKDFEKQEKVKSISYILILIIMPVLISFFVLYV